MPSAKAGTFLALAVLVMTGAGHDAPLEVPSVFHQALLGVLGEEGPSGP